MTQKEMKAFLADFKYLNRKFTVRFVAGNHARITARATLLDVDTGKNGEFSDFRDVQYKDVDEFQLLTIMRNWLMILSLHELDEHIQYKGKKVFDPHKTLNYLY